MTLVRQEVKHGLSIRRPVDCAHCKHAIPSPRSFFCVKLKQHVEDNTHCPYFESEPPEYKLYKRM